MEISEIVAIILVFLLFLIVCNSEYLEKFSQGLYQDDIDCIIDPRQALCSYPGVFTDPLESLEL